MIRASLVDHALNDLLAHFGRRVHVHPPASAHKLAELEEHVGPLPRDLTIFLATCDGLRIELHEEPTDPHLWSINEMIASLEGAGLGSPPGGMVALRGEVSGERDWLIVSPGPCHGTVIRWDPLAGEASVLAPCLGAYLSGWSAYLTGHFDPNGDPKAALHPPFDAQFMAAVHPELVDLSREGELCELLAALRVMSGAGQDVE